MSNYITEHYSFSSEGKFLRSYLGPSLVTFVPERYVNKMSYSPRAAAESSLDDINRAVKVITMIMWLARLRAQHDVA